MALDESAGYLHRYSSAASSLLKNLRLPSAGKTLAAVGGGGALWAAGSTLAGLARVHSQVSAQRWFWEKQFMAGVGKLEKCGLVADPTIYQAGQRLRAAGSANTPKRGAWYSSRAIYDFNETVEKTPADKSLPPLVYVALGDSAAQGVGVMDVKDCYVSLFASYLRRATGRRLIVLNLSVSGAVASSVIATQLPFLHKLGIQPDILTLDVGGNDVCYTDSIEEVDFQLAMEMICADLPIPALIANVPTCKPHPAERRGPGFNRVLCEAVENSPHHLVDIRTYFENYPTWKILSTRAEDGFHPNEESYHFAAGQFVQVAVPLLEEKGWLKHREETDRFLEKLAEQAASSTEENETPDEPNANAPQLPA